MSARRGSTMMLRLPRARGPNLSCPEPTHDLPIGDSLRCCLRSHGRSIRATKIAPSHHTVDLPVGILWAGIGVLHHKGPWVLQ